MINYHTFPKVYGNFDNFVNALNFCKFHKNLNSSSFHYFKKFQKYLVIYNLKIYYKLRKFLNCPKVTQQIIIIDNELPKFFRYSACL